MPELPEVEVTRAGLADRLLGARVRSAALGKPLRWPLGREVAELCGLQVGHLQRRGKYLWLPLGSPAGQVSAATASPAAPATAPVAQPVPSGLPAASPRQGGLLLHLGMSGSLSLTPQPGPAGPHDHFELATSAGTLRLTDPRRFGAVVWSDGLDTGPAAKLLGALGAEPFDPTFTAAHLYVAFQQRRTAVKTALLAGDVVVGAGNIYASEALFRARIDPRTPCRRLSLARCERLLAAVRDTLAQAIALGGSTLRDFKDVHGMAGGFQAQALVYGREGQPCPGCGAPVRRIVQGTRATYFCGRCQKR